MKFFTIQSKEVIDKLLEEDVYYPSYELGTSPVSIKSAYKEILANYNVLNKTDEKGLVFGFNSINGGSEIEDIEEVYNLVEQRPDYKQLIKDLDDGSHVILELNIESDENLVSIDFNNFIKLSLWANYLRQYNEDLLEVFTNEYEARKEILRIKKYLPNGADKSEPGSFIQVHYPVIRLEDIVDVHEMIDLETGELIEFSEKVKELKSKL